MMTQENQSKVCRRSLWLAYLMFVLIGGCCLTGQAFNRFSQFRLQSWGEEDGLGAVYDVRQAADGYIWIQAATGIFRFDGIRFESVQDVTHGAVVNSEVNAVLPASAGGIWFMTRNAGLIFWKDEHLLSFPDNRCTGRLREAPDGSLWVASSSGLFHLSAGKCQEIGQVYGYPGGVPAGLMVDREGTVWVKTWAGDLLYLSAGQTQFQINPRGSGATATFAYIHEGIDGSVWLSDGHGLRQVRGAGRKDSQHRLPLTDRTKYDVFGDFAFGTDGSVWTITPNGVRCSEHISEWRSPSDMDKSPGETLTKQQGLTSDVVWTVFVDREGNVWLATNSGLNQIRRTPFVTLALPHAQEHEFGVAAGDAGSVWTGSESLKLTHVTADGTATSYPGVGHVTCLQRDRNGILWAASKDGNHLWKLNKGKFVPVSYPHDKEQPVLSIAIDSDHALWISMRQYGIFRLSNGTWTDQNESIKKPLQTIGAMAGDYRGNVWFAFGKLLVKWDGKQYFHFPALDSPTSIVSSTMAVHNEHVWLAGSGGVNLFSQGVFHLLRWKDPTLPGKVSGLAESGTGDLWINGFSGVTHVSANEVTHWLSDPTYAVTAESFGSRDGLPGLSGEIIPKPSLVESNEGRLWFATTKGIAWVDPATLEKTRNQLPPPVAISSVVFEGHPNSGEGAITLPSNPGTLQITYTALSFAVPQRVLFRYKLEGFDKEWQNAGTRRQAFYNNLPPRTYIFRLIACNNTGVWNEKGAAVQISVAPAFYQTWWFLALSIIGVILLVCLIIKIRIGVATRELQGRHAERLDERERIARELHDTLIQGIYGLMLRLQYSVDQLDSSSSVRVDITEALNRSDAMMNEGRERIRNLQLTHSDRTSLVATFERYGRELQALSSAHFHVSLTGEAKQLNTLVQEEIVLIGREAITNAFRHSGATVIAVEVAYLWNALNIRILDNGRGLEEAILHAGSRTDHWGLPNMRARARKMRSDLRIATSSKGGTQVELRIPGSIVYQSNINVRRRFSAIFRRTNPVSITIKDQS